MLFTRLLVALLAVLWFQSAHAAENLSAAVPDYAGTATCTGCHEAEADAWRASHHSKAWMEPGPDTVDADFDNSQFTHKGRTSRFFTRDGDYFIETSDVPGKTQTFKVIGVDGIAPLQQYLIETEPGRVQSFDVVWDQQNKRWYHLYGDDAPPPEDGLHWTGPYKNWNARCAECHATGFEKNYDPATRTYSSRQAEIGVGCEACHGPGAAHLAWAKDPETYGKSPFPGTGRPVFCRCLQKASRKRKSSNAQVVIRAAKPLRTAIRCLAHRSMMPTVYRHYAKAFITPMGRSLTRSMSTVRSCSQRCMPRA